MGRRRCRRTFRAGAGGRGLPRCSGPRPPTGGGFGGCAFGLRGAARETPPPRGGRVGNGGLAFRLQRVSLLPLGAGRRKEVRHIVARTHGPAGGALFQERADTLGGVGLVAGPPEGARVEVVG